MSGSPFFWIRNAIFYFTKNYTYGTIHPEIYKRGHPGSIVYPIMAIDIMETDIPAHTVKHIVKHMDAKLTLSVFRHLET